LIEVLKFSFKINMLRHYSG